MAKIKYNPRLGAIKSPRDVRDYKRVATFAAELPEEFELELNEVKNQGAVGSCVAHSLAEVVEYFHMKQLNKTDKMSTGYIYGNREYTTYKGSGMVVRDALKTLNKCGDAFYEDFKSNYEVPLCIKKYEDRDASIDAIAYKNRITGYAKLTTDQAMKEHLFTTGPIVFAMTWYSDYKVVDGILTRQGGGSSSGGHCMVIYGWTKQGWLVRNSWGSRWGTKGNCILPYNAKRTETWAVFDTIIDDNTPIKKPSKFIKTLYKILNTILNLFRKNK